jgi:transmembrane sensor
MARFDDLLEHYRRDDMAASELEEFLALLVADASPMATPILEDLHNNAFPGLTTAAQRHLMLARILETNRRHRKAPLIRILQRAAAAAIIIALTGGTWLWFTRTPKANNNSSLSKNDIVPGTNKAVLTLSNGQKIILDSAQNGLLTQQGSTNIEKLNNGALAYLPPAPLPRGGRGKGGRGGTGEGGAFNTLSTPRGGQYKLTLPDGSKVFLNSASSLRYPTAFTGSTRSVELSGEAYFEIAKNKNSPFIVKIASTSVRVLGTHFDIMAYPDEAALNTTLLEGSVQVTRAGQTRTLAPGQQALVAADNPMITVQPADIDKAIAWTTGFFKFNHTDLHTIMREIARWYDIDVVYQTTDNTETYGGRIRRDLNLSVLIKFLESNGIHHFRIEGKRLIVLP